MNNIIIIPKVRNFIDRTSYEIEKFERAEFDLDLWLDFQKYKINSPIEQTLYCALKALIRFNYFKSISIFPQFYVGQYITDFFISNTNGLSAIIECDSQEFHDRTETERRYEKKRDRILQKEGYKIFRFTGTEILENPLLISTEILAYILGQPINNILTDSNWSDEDGVD